MLLTEYSAITNGLVNAFMESGLKRQDAVHMVHNANRIGLLSKEEQEKEAKEKINELLMSIIEQINDEREEKQDE